MVEPTTALHSRWRCRFESCQRPLKRGPDEELKKKERKKEDENGGLRTEVDGT
jgi:hypothetical protein